MKTLTGNRIGMQECEQRSAGDGGNSDAKREKLGANDDDENEGER